MNIEIDYKESMYIELGIAFVLFSVSFGILGKERSYNPYENDGTIIANDQEMMQLVNSGFFEQLDLFTRLQKEKLKNYPMESILHRPVLRNMFENFKKNLEK